MAGRQHRHHLGLPVVESSCQPPTHSLQRGRHGRAPNDRWQDPVRPHQRPEYRLHCGISDGAWASISRIVDAVNALACPSIMQAMLDEVAPKLRIGVRMLSETIRKLLSGAVQSA